MFKCAVSNYLRLVRRHQVIFKATFALNIPDQKHIQMSEELQTCPNCASPYGYFAGDGLFVCPECGHEWNPAELVADGALVVKDVNGNVLQNGDSVIVIKDLPVKGAPRPVKAGTKVKNIRIVEGDHNIDCKIEGFGAMGLKSEFVRKA